MNVEPPYDTPEKIELAMKRNAALKAEVIDFNPEAMQPQSYRKNVRWSQRRCSSKLPRWQTRRRSFARKGQTTYWQWSWLQVESLNSCQLFLTEESSGQSELEHWQVLASD
ncbi:MAG: hypothetical protein WCO86_02530 [Planctomycetota bacterium]